GRDATYRLTNTCTYVAGGHGSGRAGRLQSTPTTPIIGHMNPRTNGRTATAPKAPRAAANGRGQTPRPAAAPAPLKLRRIDCADPKSAKQLADLRRQMSHQGEVVAPRSRELTK